IYHEHFSYFSFHAVETVFRSQGLRVFDVEELPTHGGSLRIYVTQAGAAMPEQPQVAAMRKLEDNWGVTNVDTYSAFGARVEATKRDLLACLIELRRAGKRIVGYGAPG